MDGIENAKITDYSIGYESHGIFVMSVRLHGESWGQSFGNYCLGSFIDWYESPNYAFWFIDSVLKVVGVYDVKDLIGSPVRIERKDGIIIAIGNFMEDKWFNPSKELEFLTV